MAYFTCSNLTIGYAGVAVAQSVSFSVSAGEAVCVIGENGVGKSTLVKTLIGLVPPLSGDISFGDGARAGEVGYLPQRLESQRDFPASAWEVVLSGRAQRLGRRPFYSQADRIAAEKAITRVGAANLRDKPFGVLSGGQQQRVLLARALASDPKLLVLDEPVTGLDPEAAESLYCTIDELRAGGSGVISVTHDIEGAIAHASHVLAMGAGEAAFYSVSQWKVCEGGSSWGR